MEGCDCAEGYVLNGKVCVKKIDCRKLCSFTGLESGVGNPRPAGQIRLVRCSDPARGLLPKLYAIRPGKLCCDQVYGPNLVICVT